MAGRGRGRGAQPFGGLKGATWEHDATITLESKPTDLFPPHPHLKKPSPLTNRELQQLRHYKELQIQMKRGPLFTQPTKRDPDNPIKTFGEDQFNRQYGSNRQADMDPFNGVETYSMRYAPKKNVIPKLSERPFNKELFPKELWSTLDGEDLEVRKNLNRAMEKKSLLLSGMDPSIKTKILLEKIDAFDEDDEETFEDAEQDDAYDDEEGDNDYNAEQYFENGEGDEGEDDVAFGDDYT